MSRVKTLTAFLIAMTGVCASAVECDAPFDYPTGTQISYQYGSCGFVFEGVGGDPPPETYNFGTHPGSILRSHDWYSPLVVRFIDPAKPNFYRPVARIEFDNPLQLDLVYVEVFDSNGQLLTTYITTAARDVGDPVERVVIDVGWPLAAYMIIYDGEPGDSGWFGPAYTIDNLTTSLTSSLFEDGFESGDTSAWSAALP
jgi:hypothetical protein